MDPSTDTERLLEQIGKLDHSITNHYRIFGPPGAGKTYYLIDQIGKAMPKYGTSILVTSHTRNAAQNLIGRLHKQRVVTEEMARQIAILRMQVRTLHAHCYHEIERRRGEKIYLASNYVTEWNQRYPHLELTPEDEQHTLSRLEEGEAMAAMAAALDENASGADRADPDARYRDTTGLDPASMLPLGKKGGATRGDCLLAELNRLRGLERAGGPRDLRTKVLRELHELWTHYKKHHNPPLLDFTDLIEIALEEIALAPGNPAVLFVDEAQDFNRQQSRLIRQWGGRTDYFVEAGDDDQTIFAWTGASPDTMLVPELPEGHHIVLKQSRRLPRAVYSLAERWIHQIPPGRRQEKHYHPRDAEGRVQEIPGYLIEKLLLQQMEQSAEGSVMILAACRYMLADSLKVLKRLALPFHNPYRPAAAEWNPLRPGANSIRQQVVSLVAIFDRPWWTARELAAFTHGLTVARGEKPGALVYGARTELERTAENDPGRRMRLDWAELGRFFTPQALDHLANAIARDAEELDKNRQRRASGEIEEGLTGLPRELRPGKWLLQWWQMHLKPPAKGKPSPWIDFTIRAVLTWGLAALQKEPRVIVGTIHSIKGAESDTVILYQDLSPVAHEAWRTGQEAGTADGDQRHTTRDSIVRQFYVGATRARERLYLVAPADARAVNLSRFIH